jgi:RNA polymerase sigma factor FliA
VAARGLTLRRFPVGADKGDMGGQPIPSAWQHPARSLRERVTKMHPASDEPLGPTRHSGRDGTNDFKDMQAIASIAPATTQNTPPAKEVDLGARDARVNAHLHVVRSIAVRIRSQPIGRGMELDDLVAYGAQGLVEAASRFDGRRIPFVVFARRRIYGAIVDGIRSQHWFGRRADRRLRIDRAGQDWYVELAGAGHVRNDTRWNGRPMAQSPVETDDARTLRVAVNLRALPPQEQQLVDLCYYQGKRLSQAAKEMGIGRPWASRLHARALATLRAAMAEEPHLSLPPSSGNGCLSPDRQDSLRTERIAP